MISVIVPVYKVENYLRQCLDSLAAQTLDDIEIIIVDDGSPDGCPAICDEYAAKDARMKFYTGRLDDEGYVVLDKVNDNIPANTPYVIELTSETNGYANNC